MVFSSSLSASSLVSANVRQNVSLVFISPERIRVSFRQIKKYIYACIALFGFCISLPSSGYAAEVGETKTFIVTAYYSPLPGQDFYLKWNYDAEVKLNGQGTHGASGQPVYTGMIAAPKSYSFGTKIYFEWLGIGTVDDRWGAITAAGDRDQLYDRIDVWMGRGEAWLKRALIWWRRKVTGVIVESSAPGAVIDLAGIDSGKIDLSRYESVKTITNGILPTDVLQRFADLGYTTEGRTTKQMIIDFQIDHGIIWSENDPGAWSYGPLTTKKLEEEYARYAGLRDLEMERINKERQKLISEHGTWEAVMSKAEARVIAYGTPTRGQKWQNIRDLQSLLKVSGYLKSNIDGVMNPRTILALKALQKKNGLSPTGKIDARTKDILIETMIQTASLI